MKKYLWTSLLSASLMALSGCSSSSGSSSVSTLETVTGETSEASSAEASAESTTAETVVYDYVHGKDGYYNIADEMTEFEMMPQQYGDCWLHAAAASMETNIFKKIGSYTPIDPLHLLDIVYINDKDEGFIVKENIDPKDNGGWQWMVTETLSRGFDDLTLDSSVILDTADREAIKENIRTRGAVAIGVYDVTSDKKGWFGPYRTLNYTIDDMFDHDVTIIGYDDHFPKEYFKEPAAEDGAWITYNSNECSGGNYFYVSYCAPLQYAISHSVTDKYSEVLSYDAGNEQDRYIRTGDKTTTANVFHKAGKLAAVGTYNDFDTQNITIEVYSADLRELLYKQDAVLGHHGYHTIELDAPLEVSDFAVAITYEKGAPVEGEDIDYVNTDYKTVSESGQSFVRTDNPDGTAGEWQDLTDSGIREALNIDFEPGNCCIKALLAK